MKKLVTSALLAATLLGATSCKDFLTEKPVSGVAPASITSADLYINGSLNTIIGETMFRFGPFPNLWDYDNDDATGATWAFGDIGAGNFQNYWGIDNGWNGPYILINHCSFGMARIQELAMDAAAQKDAIAQLRFLRAWGYYMLVRAYGPVPLLKKSVADGETPQLPRSPVKDVYAFIIEDLKAAEADLFPAANAVVGHPNQTMAKSLLAKVYVTMASGSLASGQVTVMGGPTYKLVAGKRVLLNPVPLTHSKTVVGGLEGLNSSEYFKLARDKAQEVMSSGAYSLFPSHAEVWTVGNQNKGEHIWSLQTISNDPNFGNEVSMFHIGRINPANNEIEGGWIAESNHWYHLFEDNDQRITAGVLHRWKLYGNFMYYPYSDSSVVKGTDLSAEAQAKRARYGYQPTDQGNIDDAHVARLRKFEAVSDRSVTRGNFNYPLLRYPDVLLIYAEAANEANGGPTPEALEAVNKIRRRNSASEVKMMSQQAFRSFVLEERRRELAQEGDRRWDLLRWGIYLPVMNALDSDENNVLKRRSNKHLLMPIPVTELNINHEISGNNPGW
jgi:hypothetical protein